MQKGRIQKGALQKQSCLAILPGILRIHLMGILNIVTAENTDTNTHIHLEGKGLKEFEREMETYLSWNST